MKQLARILILFVAIVAVGISYIYFINNENEEFFDGQEISWAKMEELIVNCRVKSVFQAHSLDVSVTLKNGIKLKSVEPKIDDIVRIAVSAQNKCGNMIIATE